MKTIKLQSYRPQPYIPAIIMTVVIGVLVGVNLVATWPRQQPKPTAVPTAPLPLIVIATRAPEPHQQIVIERVIQVVVTATPVTDQQLMRAPAVEAPAPAEAPAIQVESIQPAPTATAAATPWIADPQLVHTDGGTTVDISVPTDAPRLCTGFGDWRDYDANYARSPVCHQDAP